MTMIVVVYMLNGGKELFFLIPKLNVLNYHGVPISGIIWYCWKGDNYSLKFTEVNVSPN